LETPSPPLLRSRFFWRLYAGYVVLILVVTGVVGALIEHRVRTDQLQDVKDTLHSKALLLCEIALSSRPANELQARLASLASGDPTRLTIVRADGVVLADSFEDPAVMNNHGDRPEIRAAASDGVGRSSRFSQTLGSDQLYTAVRVPAEGELIGFARTAYPLVAIEARVGQLRTVVIFGAGLAALAGLAIGYVFARRVTAPLAAVTAAVEELTLGGYGHVRAPGTPDEIGRLAEAFNKMSDELRERVEMIEADRNKLLAILSGMVEGVVAIDREERVVHMNAVAGRLLGVQPGDSTGQRVWDVTRLAEIPDILERTQNGEEFHGEVKLPSAGEETIHMEFNASPLRDAAGGRAGSVVVLHDLTELRRLEQVRSDFVANVSHELKTPLTAIRGMVETMLDDRDMEPDQARRFLDRVANQTKRLSLLVTDLLTLARIESAEVRTDRRPVDLRDPVQECASRAQPLCQMKSIQLDVDLPQTPAILVGDDEDLRQIVGNLLDNALKYTPEGGRVALRVIPKGSEILVEVEDTGIGIDPRDSERVFERFYRVDKARSRELGGTGLGLAIVKHLVLSAGGRISLDSTPGRGSRFGVHLPIHGESP
jgi:two-component system phosphate regulon sensor histidine kinase PhoR